MRLLNKKGVATTGRFEQQGHRPSQQDRGVHLFALCQNGRRINLWVVADGVGSAPCGDVAAQIAVDVYSGHFAEFVLQLESARIIGVETFIWLNRIAELAHVAIKDEQKDPAVATMASTLLAVVAVDDEVFGLWSGDSRAYVFGSICGQITVDHTRTPEKTIYAALGMQGQLYTGFFILKCRVGEVLLFTTDGLPKYFKKWLPAANLGDFLQSGTAREMADALMGVCHPTNDDNRCGFVVTWT